MTVTITTTNTWNLFEHLEKGKDNAAYQIHKNEQLKGYANGERIARTILASSIAVGVFAVAYAPVWLGAPVLVASLVAGFVSNDMIKVTNNAFKIVKHPKKYTDLKERAVDTDKVEKKVLKGTFCIAWTLPKIANKF